MADYHDLVQALTWLLVNKLQNKSEYTRGLLGDGQGQVEVPDRPDYTYVRPDRFTTRVYEVFNKTVAGPDGLPVILGELPWSPGLTQVLSVDWDTYLGVGWGDATPGIAQHGQTHEWRDGAPGVDAFNVYRRQMGELRCFPVGSGSNSIYVSPYNFTHMESLKSWPGLPGLDLSGAIPGLTGTARMALVYWDPCSGTSGWLGVATGTLGVDSETEILNLPAAPAGTIPSAWVRLAGGQGSITEFNIYDARPLWMPSLEFATGSCGIWAGIIPIGDPGDNFTGTTVEAALEELADSGGGPPSGPAGGDLTGTYPNPIVDGLLGRPLGLDPVDQYYMLMYTGSAWQPRAAPFKLMAPDGAPDPALYSDNSGNVIGVEWIAGDAVGFIVENRASGTVSTGAVGYINAEGYFVQTATEFADVAWSVVLQGGGHQQDIYVARRGRVTVTLNGNCSVGDYLYTSTTAGQAQPQSYVRPEVFAVALTANAGGAGGTCDALLLTGRPEIPIALDDNIVNISNASDSDWQTTQNGAAAGAVVTYNVPLTSGTEDAIVPSAVTELFKLVLHNTTQGEEALIESVNTGANTITVTTAGDVAGWANNDVLEVRSQTNLGNVGNSYFFDLRKDTTEISDLITLLKIQVATFRDTGGTGERFFSHPWETDSSPKRQQVQNTLTGGTGGVGQMMLIPIIQDRFCIMWTASGSGTVSLTLRVRSAIIAAP